MKFLTWLFRLAIFLVILGFALSNTEAVKLKFFATDLSWSMPLVVHLLLFFAAGVVLGLLAVVPAWYKGKRNISRLEKEARKLQIEAKQMAAPIAPPSADLPRSL
jgi:lipopolysaccharide assembly protein A